MKKATMILSAILILLVFPAAADELPTAETVLARFVAAVGGADALQRVETRRCRGTIIQDLTWTDPTHQETPFLVATNAAGDIRYAESANWSDVSAEAGADLRSKLRWLFQPRYALNVEKFFPNLAVTEMQERDGRQVVVLCSPDQKFSYYALYFDMETGLLNHMGYHNNVTDYREVGGVLYPHRVIFGRKGGHTTYVLDEVTVAR